jgi:hypothetical protein
MIECFFLSQSVPTSKTPTQGILAELQRPEQQAPLRRLVIRWEHRAENFFGMVRLGGTQILLRHL